MTCLLAPWIESVACGGHHTNAQCEGWVASGYSCEALVNTYSLCGTYCGTCSTDKVSTHDSLCYDGTESNSNAPTGCYYFRNHPCGRFNYNTENIKSANNQFIICKAWEDWPSAVPAALRSLEIHCPATVAACHASDTCWTEFGAALSFIKAPSLEGSREYIDTLKCAELVDWCVWPSHLVTVYHTSMATPPRRWFCS